MVYKPLIPLPTDNLSVSQGDIKENFTVANTSFGINHYPFDDATANNGKHKKVSMPQTTIPTSVLGELILYNKGVSPGGSSALFMVRDGVPATDTQLTCPEITAPLSTAQGYTFLPGGIILQWGVVTFPPFLNAAQPFNVAFPNACWNMQVSMTGVSGSPNNIGIASTTLSTFNWKFTGSGTSSFTGFYWQAIGN